MRSLHSSCLAVLTLLSMSNLAAAQDAPPVRPDEPPPAPPAAPVAVPAQPAPATLPAAPTPKPEPALAAPAEPEVKRDPTVAKDGHPLAGWHGGLFYLRDPNDNFRLYIQGRAQVDGYSYFGPGVGDSALKATFLLRRIRPELTGEILNRFNWMLAGDWGSTAVDNGKGTNETSAAAPGAAPSATSGRYASAQTASIRAVVTDVWINTRVVPELNIQIGQYDAPFSLENRTSDKYLPFMERSLAVRALGIPTNKEMGLMLWGETRGKHLGYLVGGFAGDGQNRLNMDNNFDVIGRVFAHPLASMQGVIKDLQIGGSFRAGSRDPKSVFYDYAGMTTQGNFAFWSPTYTGSKGATHILPSGNQNAFAAELRVPVSIVDFTSEFVYVKNGTREAIEGFQGTNTERLGEMSGYGYYLQVGVWPFGNRDINGKPGYENPSHVDFSKPDRADPLQSLQLLAKWEQLAAKYSSASRGGKADASNVDGNIKVNALSFGANYWFTKHLRLSVNYVFDMFPDSEPTSPSTPTGPKQSAKQRAVAPGNTLAAGIDDKARDRAHELHELLFRVGVSL